MLFLGSLAGLPSSPHLSVFSCLFHIQGPRLALYLHCHLCNRGKCCSFIFPEAVVSLPSSLSF